jgi:hypothetical protein
MKQFRSLHPCVFLKLMLPQQCFAVQVRQCLRHKQGAGMLDIVVVFYYSACKHPLPMLACWLCVLLRDKGIGVYSSLRLFLSVCLLIFVLRQCLAV